MEALEAQEPEDEASEAYDKWIEECEQLAIESESLMTLTMSHTGVTADGVKYT